jgi:hypothetical protein
LIPTLFVILADPQDADAQLGPKLAAQFSKEPDCRTMPTVWAIRTESSPGDVLAFIRENTLVESTAAIVVASVTGEWATANAKREPDCWKGGGGIRLNKVSGNDVAEPSPYQVSSQSTPRPSRSPSSFRSGNRQRS